jgi:hypothetical protein
MVLEPTRFPGEARTFLEPVMPVRIAPVPTEPLRMKSRLDIRLVDTWVIPHFIGILIVDNNFGFLFDHLGWACTNACKTIGESAPTTPSDTTSYLDRKSAISSSKDFNATLLALLASGDGDLVVAA